MTAEEKCHARGDQRENSGAGSSLGEQYSLGLGYPDDTQVMIQKVPSEVKEYFLAIMK